MLDYLALPVLGIFANFGRKDGSSLQSQTEAHWLLRISLAGSFRQLFRDNEKLFGPEFAP
jgi:hypothetical protein